MSNITQPGEKMPREGAVVTEPTERRAPFALGILFAVYLALLAWTILFKLEVPYIGAGGLRHVKWVPFAADDWYAASKPLEVGANVLLFLPFGMYLGLLWPTRTVWKHVATLAGASMLLEGLQYLLIVGSSDVTDVIANTVGGATGLLVVALWGRRSEAGARVLKRVCMVGTGLAVVICLAFFFSPLHYAQRDVTLDQVVD
ncbi:VanZ family protein [Microbacterium sp. H1-D42]|uniref:VanZ family protein n=1 Tax=Microbacterium sp. H1-D42 TaxID=2925844 RepID=UPI001F53896A|nr:VanZ family protein [Microbacterium sp. H1-D42]UNK72055.1 VanZ family protein [Microbacterium sp. H1-D42]